MVRANVADHKRKTSQTAKPWSITSQPLVHGKVHRIQAVISASLNNAADQVTIM